LKKTFFTINGGVITAKGDNADEGKQANESGGNGGGAGIGGGGSRTAGSAGKSGGNITINGGTVIAQGGNGGKSENGFQATGKGGGGGGAGIGGGGGRGGNNSGGAGSDGGAGGIVTVNGGVIMAIGGFVGTGDNTGGTTAGGGGGGGGAGAGLGGGGGAGGSGGLGGNGTSTSIGIGGSGGSGGNAATGNITGSNPTPAQTQNGNSITITYTYTITFDQNGGTGVNPSSSSVEDVSIIAAPTANPTRNGYEFNGWWTANGSNNNNWGDQWNFEKKVKENITLYARWILIPYDITYNLNGGTGVSNGTYNVETPTFTLPTPTRDGYLFVGWFNNPNFTGGAITSIFSGDTGNKQFWALWVIIQPILPTTPYEFDQWTGKVTLNWSYNNSYDVTGKFFVYRREDGVTAWTPLNSAGVTAENGNDRTMTYTDNNNNFGKTFEYCIGFVEGTGNAPASPDNIHANFRETVQVSTAPSLGSWNVTATGGENKIYMKKQIIKIVATGLFFLSGIAIDVQAQHEFSVSGGGGLSTLDYNVSTGKQKNGYGGQLGLGYCYFFSSDFGVGTGVEYALYNAGFNANSISTCHSATDIDGDDFEFRSAIVGYHEHQQATLLQIPLMLHYQISFIGRYLLNQSQRPSAHSQTGYLWKFYASAGAKAGIPISGKYTGEAAIINNSGVYADEVYEYKTQRFMGFGTFTDKNIDGDLELKTALLLSLETGVKLKIKRELWLYVGAYLDYGLNNIAKAQNSFVEYNTNDPRNFLVNSVAQSQYAPTGGSEQPFTYNLKPVVAGVKLKLALGN